MAVSVLRCPSYTLGALRAHSYPIGVLRSPGRPEGSLEKLSWTRAIGGPSSRPESPRSCTRRLVRALSLPRPGPRARDSCSCAREVLRRPGVPPCSPHTHTHTRAHTRLGHARTAYPPGACALHPARQRRTVRASYAGYSNGQARGSLAVPMLQPPATLAATTRCTGDSWVRAVVRWLS